MERNPYYWKVDQEGNQLPYIDRITHDLIEDREVINLKAVAGELDFQGRHIRIENFPLFMESREKGDYRVLRIKKGDGSKVTFNPNLTCKEPVLRQLFADDRFRKALSVAIDRDEINEIVFQGLGTPRQASIIEGGAFYSEEWANAYTEYDPDKAATLLDEIGLKWDNEKKYRLRPDGQVLAVTIESREGKTEETTSELVKSYWEEIGVKTAVKIEDRSLFESRRDGNDMEIALWDYSAFNFLLDPLQMVPVRHQYYWYGTYGLWNEMNGAQGEKPTGDVARLLELWSVILSAQTTEERDAAAEEIVKLHTKNIWSIGTVGQNPSLFIVKNNLRNVPQEGVIDDDVLRTPGNLDPWQFFFK
jgi:peptide/nickel transport system substrate-binding protein